ncbi:hypothetical protein [Lysobacter gummosus]|uniref:hypothetical protein n=1 Tax=Lysobacter gummosus TaxID=262324 RepID=UPI00362A7655
MGRAHAGGVDREARRLRCRSGAARTDRPIVSAALTMHCTRGMLKPSGRSWTLQTRVEFSVRSEDAILGCSRRRH